MNASSRPQAPRSLAGFASVRSVATWRKGPMRLGCSSGGSARRMVSIRRSLASAGVKRTNTPPWGPPQSVGGRLGADRQGADECVRGGRGRGDGAPPLPAVGALEDAANEEATDVAATGRIEGGRGLGINGQATGKTNTAPEIVQSCGVPTSPAVGALVNAPDVRTVVGGPHARVEGGGGLGVEDQSRDILDGPGEPR